MPTTKLKNGQLPDTIAGKTVDNTNDISTTTTKLKISGGSNGQVLSTDGSGNLSWITPGGGGGIWDGDKGDITVSGSGATWTIDNDAITEAKIANGAVTAAKIANGGVTYSKIQNVTASRLLGRGSSGSGVAQEITLGTGLSFSGTTLNVTTSGPTTVISKTANESVTNSATLQLDNDFVATLSSNRMYLIELLLLVDKLNDNSNPTLKISMSGSDGGMWKPDFSNVWNTTEDTSSFTFQPLTGFAGMPHVVRVSATLNYLYPTTTIALLWAQGTSNPNSVIILKNSKMYIYDLGAI